LLLQHHTTHGDANFSDGDVISACISKDAFMRAPDESSIKKDFPEKATEWIAADGKRCTDGEVLPQKYYSKGDLVLTPSLKSRAGDTAPDFWCFRRFCWLLPVSCPHPHTRHCFLSARRCGRGWVVVTDSKRKCWLRVHSLGAHYSVAGLAPWYIIEVSYMLFLLGFTRCSSIVQVLAINNCSIWEIVEQMKFTIRFSTNSAHNNNCRGVRA